MTKPLPDQLELALECVETIGFSGIYNLHPRLVREVTPFRDNDTLDLFEDKRTATGCVKPHLHLLVFH